MKVIKEGKEIKGIMRVTCKTCETKLEIQAGDLKKQPIDRPFAPLFTLTNAHVADVPTISVTATYQRKFVST